MGGWRRFNAARHQVWRKAGHALGRWAAPLKYAGKSANTGEKRCGRRLPPVEDPHRIPSASAEKSPPRVLPPRRGALPLAKGLPLLSNGQSVLGGSASASLYQFLSRRIDTGASRIRLGVGAEPITLASSQAAAQAFDVPKRDPAGRNRRRGRLLRAGSAAGSSGNRILSTPEGANKSLGRRPIWTRIRPHTDRIWMKISASAAI